MLLPEQKIIFIHIPKCAGSSIASGLFHKSNYPNFKGYIKMPSSEQKNYRTTVQMKHNTISAYEVKNIDSYYKFTVIRNPYDRFISSYFWKTQHNSGLTLNEYLNQAQSFLEKHKDDERLNVQKDISHFLPQKNYVMKDGENVMDDIFRFEDTKKIFKRLDLKYQHKKNLKSKNKLAKLDPKNLTDIQKRIEELYEMDYEYFGFDGAATKNVTIL